VGGRSDHATLNIYLPAGYDSSSARYPVIYLPAAARPQWDRSMRFSAMMDGLISSGTIPPEIVIFVDQAGGPFSPSECANSWDGKEWFDRYLSQTVPPWVDSHLRTIATPAARTLFGFSSGGYCAAAALTNHPDVFGNGISFSGYFAAGIRSRSTPNAWVVFNGDPVLEAKVSPINVVPQLAPDARSKIFMAMSASPDDWFYGTQVSQFARVLDANGVPMAILPTTLGHSWAAIRDQLPMMLTILVARQAKLGVFGGS
jgi:enterochelin esterase-like enzyme